MILMLPGWSESVGLKMEIAKAEEWGIPVVFASFENVMNGNYKIESN